VEQRLGSFLRLKQRPDELALPLGVGLLAHAAHFQVVHILQPTEQKLCETIVESR
jgi:hypothetical protein